MAIPTSRTKESPRIHIDPEICTGCGLCVDVCSDKSLQLAGKTAARSKHSQYDCIGCGHCMAVCPTGAVTVTGRELSAKDVFDLPTEPPASNYDQLLRVLQHRRSIRDFSDKAITQESIDKILVAAKTAPMGLPPSDVNVLIFNGKEKTRDFAEDFSSYLKGLRFMTNPIFLAAMRPFWGKDMDELMKGFLQPLFTSYTTEGIDKGINYITYDAPLAMYFYGSPLCDPADPIIAATYAMVVAETLGLGTCMLGAIHPFIQKGRKAKAFRERHNIKHTSKEGLFVIFGYPKAAYKKGIRRTFASVEYSK